ncbi:MAG: hypothetical protein A3G17_04965 [Planctomycetes bacterium RIFCSPLOWO2_12_FULL_50_35]|nr:MAG: hypothetical protein A3G17_04965 [Planctomycetes bacterium RIFCSPLOWO2_12_FULL_50_35]
MYVRHIKFYSRQDKKSFDIGKFFCKLTSPHYTERRGGGVQGSGLALVLTFTIAALIPGLLVFDVEVVFFYPWAVLYNDLSIFGLIEMTVFILIVALALIYAWKEGALEWR